MTTNHIAIPAAADNERYIGGTIAADGTVTLIYLLPGTFTGTWKKAGDWAKQLGGDLPSRMEQAMLYATAKEEFEPSAHWSNETHAACSGYAWCQYFGDGDQGYYRKSAQLRARAVRRLVIQSFSHSTDASIAAD